jgi:hypothetical protein
MDIAGRQEYLSGRISANSIFEHSKAISVRPENENINECNPNPDDRNLMFSLIPW